MDSVRSQMDAMTLKYDDMYVHRQQMEQQLQANEQQMTLNQQQMPNVDALRMELTNREEELTELRTKMLELRFSTASTTANSSNNTSNKSEMVPLLVDQQEMRAFQLLYQSLVKNEEILRGMDHDVEEETKAYGKFVRDYDGEGGMTSSLDWKADHDELQRMRQEVRRVREERDAALKDARQDFDHATSLLREQHRLELSNQVPDNGNNVLEKEKILAMEQNMEAMASLQAELEVKEAKIEEVTQNWTFNHNSWEEAFNKQAEEMSNMTKKMVEQQQMHQEDVMERQRQWKKDQEKQAKKEAADLVEERRNTQLVSDNSDSTPTNASIEGTDTNSSQKTEEQIAMQEELRLLREEKESLVNEAEHKKKQHALDIATIEEKQLVKLKILQKKHENKAQRLQQQRRQEDSVRERKNKMDEEKKEARKEAQAQNDLQAQREMAHGDEQKMHASTKERMAPPLPTAPVMMAAPVHVVHKHYETKTKQTPAAATTDTDTTGMETKREVFNIGSSPLSLSALTASASAASMAHPNSSSSTSTSTSDTSSTNLSAKDKALEMAAKIRLMRQKKKNRKKKRR